MKLLLIFLAALLQVQVEQGTLEGELIDGTAVYKAIPYAEAPVGDLRWKAPVKKAPWTGVYKADNWGARPPQPVDPNQNGGGLPMSEDCLYLGIQTPAQSADEKLPVFVMIHGGAFMTGSYSGIQTNFVEQGIVYVSIEYRLGAFGFMAHPALSKEDPRGVSGNYGLMDQIMALEWIHNNIAAFGGDPDKVTICGESAGGISVSMLCASPKAKGLFRGAISESGGSFWPVAEARGGNTAMCTARSAEQSGVELQKSVGAKNIKALRKVPAEQIVANTRMEMFWPVVDGDVIIDDQYKLYEQGNYNDVNILVGTNSDEGWLFTFPMPVEAYEARIRETYGEWADRLLKLYPATTPEEVRFAMSDIFRDGTFAWCTYAWANLQSKTGQTPAYLYYFDQLTKNPFGGSVRGACHVAEMPFIYGWQWGELTDVETRMGEIMRRYWINFIKYGDPNGQAGDATLLPYWAPFKEGTRGVMNMHEGFRMTELPNADKLAFFEEYFRAHRK